MLGNTCAVLVPCHRVKSVMRISTAGQDADTKGGIRVEANILSCSFPVSQGSTFLLDVVSTHCDRGNMGSK